MRNRAEYLSEWRSDVEGLIPYELVELCVGDYYELPPDRGVVYYCFVDAATGVPGGDSYAMAISHKAGDKIVIDALREVQPPFAPAVVINTILVPLCKSYKIYNVVGDNYAGEFAQALVRGAGLNYELAKKNKSQLYVDPLLPLLNSQQITLPRDHRAVNQIASLERSALRSGREHIDHPVHGHDDLANCIAGAASLAYDYDAYDTSGKWFNGPTDPEHPEAELDAWRALNRHFYIMSGGNFRLF